MYKMLQVREPTVIKTIDDQGVNYLLDGIGKKRGAALASMGCTWIRGLNGPGAWELTATIAQQFIDRNVAYIERDLRTQTTTDVTKGQ